jgi:predicted secreted protein
VPELLLEVGETHELELAGRGSAGYAWQSEVDTEGVVAVRRLPPPDEPHGPVSGSAPARFAIEAVAPGRAHIRLTLRRPWEPSVAPLDEQQLTIVVAGA